MDLTLKNLTEEQIAEIKKIVGESGDCDWNREPRDDYYRVDCDGDISSDCYYLDFDRLAYARFNCFPCTDYTKEELEQAKIADMSTLERMAYKFGHFHGDWLSEEERLSFESGYGVWYAVNAKEWVNDIFGNSFKQKWFGKAETSKAFAEWLNDNCDHKGVLKGANQ